MIDVLCAAWFCSPWLTLAAVPVFWNTTLETVPGELRLPPAQLATVWVTTAPMPWAAVVDANVIV